MHGVIILYSTERQAHIKEDSQTGPGLLEGTANITLGHVQDFHQSLFIYMTKKIKKRWYNILQVTVQEEPFVKNNSK